MTYMQSLVMYVGDVVGEVKFVTTTVVTAHRVGEVEE